MLEQQRFQFSRSHLPPVRLNQLLESIHYEEPAFVVTINNISGAQPAIRIDRLRRGLRCAEIAFHYLWAAYPDLTLLVRAQLSPGRVVDNFALSIGKTVANGAWLMSARVGETGMGQWAYFRQAVAVSNRAAQTLGASARNIVGERGGATMNQPQR